MVWCELLVGECATLRALLSNRTDCDGRVRDCVNGIESDAVIGTCHGKENGNKYTSFVVAVDLLWWE